MKAFKKYYLIVLLISALAVSLHSCKKDLPANPYAPYNIIDTSGTVVEDTIDPNSFAGLHKNIFSKTCANSGCHDGTFEPDYRTIESAYNTLVYHPIIKNTTQGTYTYRVVPGNVSASMLYLRVTEDLNGNSGIMPLSVDPESDWTEKKDAYIQNIKTWIENGAKDPFGNSPPTPNEEPYLQGIVAFADGGTTPLDREPNGVIIVPPGTNTLDIWFSFKDDVTPVTSLGVNQVKFSMQMHDFSNATTQNLTVTSSPIQYNGKAGTPVNYYHKVSLDPFSQWAQGTDVFMRVYVQDQHHPVTEIPETSSAPQTKTYCTFRLDMP